MRAAIRAESLSTPPVDSPGLPAGGDAGAAAAVAIHLAARRGREQRAQGLWRSVQGHAGTGGPVCRHGAARRQPQGAGAPPRAGLHGRRGAAQADQGADADVVGRQGQAGAGGIRRSASRATSPAQSWWCSRIWAMCPTRKTRPVPWPRSGASWGFEAKPQLRAVSTLSSCCSMVVQPWRVRCSLARASSLSPRSWVSTSSQMLRAHGHDVDGHPRGLVEEGLDAEVERQAVRAADFDIGAAVLGVEEALVAVGVGPAVGHREAAAHPGVDLADAGCCRCGWQTGSGAAWAGRHPGVEDLLGGDVVTVGDAHDDGVGHPPFILRRRPSPCQVRQGRHL